MTAGESFNLGLLQEAVQLEADLAAIEEGKRPGATSASVIRAAVLAAFTCAVQNKLVYIRPPDEWAFIIERNKP